MYDESSATFEMLKRANTMQIIAVHNGKILLARQEQPIKGPYTGFIGGRQEENETPLAAAKRELLEEVSMEARKWKAYRVYQPVGKIAWGGAHFHSTRLYCCCRAIA